MFSSVFQHLIKDISENGETCTPRDLQVKEQMFTKLPINPIMPFANYSSREFNWKYFAGELAWYLKKDNDVDYISDYSNFWSTITNPNSNEINSNYGTLLFGEQLNWVVDSLKSDKNSRQAIAFLNQPKFQFEGNKDFVCTMYLNFLIRNNQLFMKVTMRSNDIFYGLTFDAPFFAFVHQHVYLWLKETYPELELGYYWHFSDNTHFYERHFELANDILHEDINATDEYKMEIKTPLFNVNKDGMELTHYGKLFLHMMDDSNPKESKINEYKTLLTPFLGLSSFTKITEPVS